jgi:hypothetical protein
MAAPGKQATVYIVDLGSTMAECNSGRVETDLDFGMKYIWDKIATTMAANLKGGNLGVIGLRTDETNNPLDVDGYENLSVSIPLVRVAHFEQNQPAPWSSWFVKQHLCRSYFHIEHYHTFS